MAEVTIDRLRNANNYNQQQNKYKRVLCVCSGGLLRSPTTAWVLGNEPYNHNTRSAGLNPQHALICVDDVLIEWADQIVVMEEEMKDVILNRWDVDVSYRPIVVLGIPDYYRYRQDQLINLIRARYPVALESALKIANDNEPRKPVVEKDPIPDFTSPQVGEGPKIDEMENDF